MRHQALRVNGASLHIAELGEGAPLLLLHGWPEFWLTWEPVMLRLSKRYRLIAPDLRGFGDSDKPSGPFGPADHAADMLALLDALGIRRAGIVGHDVGGCGDAAACAQSAGARRSTVLFRLRLSGNWAADGRAGSIERDLVSIFPSDGSGTGARGRLAADL